MNIFLRSLTVGLIPLAMWVVAAAASDSNVLMEEMTTTEVRDAIKMGKTTALIFNGSTEASGPHLVLGKHSFRRKVDAAGEAHLVGDGREWHDWRYQGVAQLATDTLAQIAGSEMSRTAEMGVRLSPCLKSKRRFRLLTVCVLIFPPDPNVDLS